MSVAIVTGASRGLGLALTRALAERGWRLVVDARDPGALERAVAGLEGVVAVAGDVSDAEHRRALVDAAGDRVDLLVNNASLLGPSPLPGLAEYPLEELARVYETNVFAPLALVQLALPRLAPGAAIVDVTSDAAVEAYEGWGGYGSSKAALDQLTAILAAEHPELRVYAVDPGRVRPLARGAADERGRALPRWPGGSANRAAGRPERRAARAAHGRPAVARAGAGRRGVPASPRPPDPLRLRPEAVAARGLPD